MARTGGGLGAAFRSDGGVFKTHYPMYVIPVAKLMQLSKFHVHREMLAKGLLRTWTKDMKGKVIVVSHQWLSYAHPDPQNEHFLTLKRILDRLINGEVKKVEDYWLHTMMFCSKGITAEEWRDSLPNMYVWIDYCCMPQVGLGADEEAVQASCQAVQSIPAYVERSALLLVLAPICNHQDTNGPCNFATWRSRGWCRMEMMSAILAPRHIRVMVCTGGDATPFLLHPFEGPRLPVGEGEFTCCSVGHCFKGMIIRCDKMRVRTVLAVMLQAKVQQLRAEGRTSEQHWYGSMEQAFLKDLPAPEAGCRSTGDYINLHSFLQMRREHGLSMVGCDGLKRRLTWTAEDDKKSLKSGFTLMMCAALADDTLAIQQLAETEVGALINVGLKKHFYHLAFMWKGVRPLGAAMAFASWATIEALLDAKAEPEARAANGMDALFFACCKGNLENIKGWLHRFPDWNLERNIPVMGMNPLCAAIVSGCRKAPVLRQLISARANLAEKKRWGGESAALCLVANNEDSQTEALQLLLHSGCNVNGRWTPHTTLFSVMLKAARLGGRVAKYRPLAELSLLEGSTPLHFAAKRGDVAMVKQLVAAQADVHMRNAEGRRPIDVARAFFAGQVPLLLSGALLIGADDISSSMADVQEPMDFAPHSLQQFYKTAKAGPLLSSKPSTKIAL